MKNFRKTINEIWKDPVLSKIIATIILALMTVAYNFIASKLRETSFTTEFINFWNLNIRLWEILLFIFILFLLYISTVLFGFQYDDKTLQLDIFLFNRIRNELLTQQILLEARDNGYSTNPFEHEKIDFIFSFLEESKKSDFEFINPRLEIKKKKVVSAVNDFHKQTSKYIFGTNNSGWLSIPKE